MRKSLFFLLLCYTALLLPITFHAQSIGINDDASNPDPSAMLDVKSTTRGLLTPRMDKTQRNAITSPATGLLVYQNGPDSAGFHYYDGARWQWLDTLAWKIGGNSNITAAHFLGTINNAALRFRVNNIPSGLIDSTSQNTTFGFRTAQFTTGTSNVAIGYMAGRNLATSSYNTVIGYEALGSFAYTGASEGIGSNTAIGARAMYSLNPTSTSNGGYNTAVGYSALYKTTTGRWNTAIGYNSMSGSIAGDMTGEGNTAVGVSALNNTTSGNNNVAIGMNAMQANTTGNTNIAIGYAAMQNAQSGTSNIVIGEEAGYSNASGNLNIAIGYQAMRSNQNRSNNVAIGTRALFYNGTGVPANDLVSALDNTAVGDSAMYWNFGGYGNTAMGVSALYNSVGFNNVAVGKNAALNTTTGNKNVAIGRSALELNTTGSSNTAIGDSANVGVNNLTNATAIGANARVDVSNAMVLGSINGINGATASTKVGIGTTTPTASLHVNSNFILGANSPVLSNILKTTQAFDIPDLAGGATTTATFIVSNATVTGIVAISPATELVTGVVIASARVSAVNTVEVKFSNITGANIDPASMNFYISVIQ
jgi:trimeric autotransporter adhesin